MINRARYEERGRRKDDQLAEMQRQMLQMMEQMLAANRDGRDL